MKAPNPGLADWIQATFDLLPRGLMWPRDLKSKLGKIVSVIAQERQARHQRKLILLEIESVPTSAVELLPEWEKALGLPDPCLAAPTSLAARWAAIADVFFADHAPTPANMVTWAALAGWNVTIQEQSYFIPGLSVAGDTVGQSDFVWVVTVLGQARTYFRAEQSTSGDPLWDFPDLTTLQCVLRRASPAHLQVFFYVP
jgi:uncharacterized protein YmfQ (DUF2313 family)